METGEMVSQMRSAQAPPDGAGETVAALAEQILNRSSHGSTYFYPSTSTGTPLALIGFAFGLALLSIIQAGWLNANPLRMVVPVAFGFSALATIVGGLWEFRAGNLFGSVWEVTYGGFWLSLGLILGTYGAQITKASGPVAFREAFGTYLILLAIVTVAMAVAAYFVAAPAFIAFVLLVALEVILGLGQIYANSTLTKVGAYVGLVDAAVALYVAAVILINTTAGEALLPLWAYPYRRTPAAGSASPAS
jgi:succinate-acetate transporter protein